MGGMVEQWKSAADCTGRFVVQYFSGDYNAKLKRDKGILSL